jgi:excinuclease ABC subunit C
VYSYWRKSANHTPAKKAMMKEIVQIEWLDTETEIEAFLLEANLIKKYQPTFNIDLRDDKRFVYIKVSTEDEVPGVFITRKIDRAGKYFGPFTNVAAVRETMKALRKIWPYCTERKIKNKPCFYYQIHRCTGVCGEKIAPKDYQEQIMKPTILFLSGKKKRIVSAIKKEISELEKKDKKGVITEEEVVRLEQLRFKKFNMQKVLEHTNIISVAEKYAADVVELAKVMALPHVPERIEGYDISNIFGREAVGSMVVFKNGEPDKNEYRKFKIKIGQGEANDTKMLREIIERRFKNDWPMPDLMIIDGGKGQLNAVMKELKKQKSDIPVIAISKGAGLRSAAAPDKIFFPGEKKPLELPIASPALHVIKRVRDEAHRFAIKYHQLLRRKKILKR